ncbi:MAG: prepilin-type N-terminal cleavage/methylation domain-containing protein [Phycisphaerae bacterium]|nr:prepilin-type N-terminal cleavage/methylation domain-containing protein [Phycisphaerae bacterium]
MKAYQVRTRAERLVAWRQGFTLIELLVVVAIIALLIGILLPSLGAARDSAKRVKTKASMKGIGDCLELFAGENDKEERGQRYPSSTAGDDPTENGNSTGEDTDLFGAQWVVRYLMGKKMDGYVARDNVPRVYWGNEAGEEQLGWYDNPGDANFPPDRDQPFPRSGPYLTTDAVKTKLTGKLRGAPSDLSEVTANSPVIIDEYERPILYYAARTRQAAKTNANIATSGGATYDGIYNFGDNVLFTGGKLSSPTGIAEFETWDFGSGTNKKLEFPADWERSDPPDWPVVILEHPMSFPHYIMNRHVFDSTDHGEGGSVIPCRKDSYLLITPGKDGQFGTQDDVTNFQ